MEHEMTAGAGPLGSGEDVMRDGGRSSRTGEQLGSEHQPASTARHLLADWKAKTDAATEGPWEFSFAGHDDYEPGLYPQVLKMDNGDTIIELDAGSREVNEASSPFRYDADFIAVSRTAMPRLLAAVAAIRALIAEHERIEFHNANVSINRISDLEREPTSEDYRRALDAALSGSEPDEGSGR